MSPCCGWAHGQPGGDGGAHGGIFEPGVEAGQLLQGDGSGVGRHAPRAVRERAPLGSQVFEEQGEAAVVGRGCVVGAGHPQVEGPGDIGVELASRSPMPLAPIISRWTGSSGASFTNSEPDRLPSPCR